jgi:hypothetical protein
MKTMDERLDDMYANYDRADIVELLHSYNCHFSCSADNCEYYKFTKDDEYVTSQVTWHKALYLHISSLLENKFGIRLVFDDSTFEPETAKGVLVKKDSDSQEFRILENPYRLDENLASSADVLEAVKDQKTAVDLYRALCNVDWYKNGISWSCSWRSAGGIVAELRDVGEDYMDFYCSGGEGQVSEKIRALLCNLNWLPNPEDLKRNSGI